MEVQDVQKNKTVPTPKKQNLCELQFAKDYGLLGQVVLNAFRKNTCIPENYTGNAQEYYIKLSTDFLRQMHNGLTRFVLTAMIENSAIAVDMHIITNSIMTSLYKTP